MLRLALEIIQRECYKYANCERCPLRDPNTVDMCMLQNRIPQEWIFKHREEEYEESVFM